MRASGAECFMLAGDLADEGYCRDLVEQTAGRFGRIDILVNNAAFQGKHVDRFEDITGERVERTFRVNIMAMFHPRRASSTTPRRKGPSSPSQKRWRRGSSSEASG